MEFDPLLLSRVQFAWVIAWHILTDNCDYQDLGGEYFIRRDTERSRQRAIAQLQSLGYRVTIEPAA